jgi:hypothetical protein
MLISRPHVTISNWLAHYYFKLNFWIWSNSISHSSTQCASINHLYIQLYTISQDMHYSNFCRTSTNLSVRVFSTSISIFHRRSSLTLEFQPPPQNILPRVYHVEFLNSFFYPFCKIKSYIFLNKKREIS